jgi:large-conductance mechanosensitive channel
MLSATVMMATATAPSIEILFMTQLTNKLITLDATSVRTTGFCQIVLYNIQPQFFSIISHVYNLKSAEICGIFFCAIILFMNALLQSQVFFFISSVGFVVLWILTAIFLFYLIRATNTFSKIMEKVEKDVNDIGDTTKEMLDDMRDNPIFNFFFKKKRKHRKD